MDASETVLPVSRPAGVTAAAVVAAIGSVLALLAAAAFFSVPIPPGPQNGINMRAFSIGMSAFIAALAGLGIWTSVGLFRLRPWARMSILSFAIIMGSIAALTMVILVTVPIPTPPGRDPRIAKQILPGMLLIYSVPVLVSAWWIIQFTRPRTKAAFAAQAVPGESARPLSISILGWMHLLGGVFVAFIVVSGMPLLVAGVVLTGWSARVAYTLLALLGVYIGWGLLKLNETARRVAIGYIGVTWAHGLLVSVVPSMRAKLTDLETRLQPAGSPPPPDIFGSSPAMIIVSASLGLAVAGLMIWFLVKHKQAFTRTNPTPIY